VLTALGGPVPGTNQPARILGTEETVLGQLPLMVERINAAVRADNRSAAYPVRHGTKWSVWRDGTAGELYDSVHSLTFSPDGRHFAYCGRRGKEKWLWVDDQIRKVRGISPGSILYSPDSAHMLFKGGRFPPGTNIAKVFVVLDGKAGPEFDALSVSNQVFSPDSQRLAYVGSRRAENPQGKVPRVAAGRAEVFFLEDFVVVDGKESPAYDDTSKQTLVFSPDSQHVAYGAKRSGKCFVVVDGVEEKATYDAIVNWSVRFSPDSRRLAYAALRNNQWLIIADHREGRPYDGLDGRGILFSPDSKQLVYTALKGSKVVLVVDGVEKAEFDFIAPASVRFSPDGRHLAYTARRGGRAMLVLDGKPVNHSCDEMSDSQLLFSPDSCRVATVARRNNKFLTVEADGEGGEYDKVWDLSLTFSPDSKHLAYVAVRQRKTVIVVDGQETRKYESAFRKLVFEGSESVRALVTRFDNAFREELVSVAIRVP